MRFTDAHTSWSVCTPTEKVQELMVVVEKYRKELGDLNVGIRKGKESRKVGKLVFLLDKGGMFLHTRFGFWHRTSLSICKKNHWWKCLCNISEYYWLWN